MVSVEAYSPDGRWIAVTGLGRQVRIFDADGRPTPKHVLEHPGNVSQARFAPGSKQLASVVGQEVFVWDVETGRQIGEPLAHDALVTAIAFSPDGGHLATAVKEGDTRVWSLSSGTPVSTIPIKAWELAFIDGGRALVLRQGGSLHAFRAATGAAIGKPVGRRIQGMAAVSTPGGKLASVDTQRVVQLWKLTEEGLSPQGDPRPHPNYVTGLAFSSLGNLLVSASAQGVWLWVEGSETPHGPPLHGAGVVLDMQLSQDTTLLTLGGDGGARVWDLVPHARSKPLAASNWNRRSPPPVFSPDGRHLLTLGGVGHAQLWSVESGKPIGPKLEQGEPIRALALGAGGKTVLSAGNRAVRVWEVPSGKMLSETTLDPAHELSLAAFTPDLRTLLASGLTGCGAWDVATGKQLWQTAWRDGGWPRAISRDSRWFAVARSGEVQDIAVFDARTGALRHSLLKNLPRPDALEFSPNSQLLAATVHDQVYLWNLNDGRPWGEPLRHLDRVVSLDWSPDGKLLTSSWDRTARIWDVRARPVAAGVSARPHRVRRGVQSRRWPHRQHGRRRHAAVGRSDRPAAGRSAAAPRRLRPRRLQPRGRLAVRRRQDAPSVARAVAAAGPDEAPAGLGGMAHRDATGRR